MRSLQSLVRRVAIHLPEVVNVDVSPTVIDQAAIDHCICRGFDPLFRHRVGETIPTVPSHRRSEADLWTANDLEPSCSLAQRILGAEHHYIFAFLFQLASDATGLRIKLQSRWQTIHRKTHGPIATGRDRKEKRRAGTH